MKLFFGNKATTATTLLLVGLAVFWTWALMTRETVEFWGLKSLFLLIYGLVICCYAATRDGFDKTVQYTIDKSCQPGIFSLVSLPTVIAYAGALAIIVSAIATPIARSPESREVWFYIMSGGVALKIVTIEVTRIFLYFKYLNKK